MADLAATTALFCFSNVILQRCRVWLRFCGVKIVNDAGSCSVRNVIHDKKKWASIVRKMAYLSMTTVDFCRSFGEFLARTIQRDGVRIRVKFVPFRSKIWVKVYLKTWSRNPIGLR